MNCAFKKNKNDRCQFEQNGTELIDYKGEYYCEFHLPADKKFRAEAIKDGRNVDVYHKEFNDKIFRIIDETPDQELINLRGVVFPNFIDLSKRVFTGKIDFAYATFCGDVSFREDIFEVDSDFSYTTFRGFPDFLKAQFSYVLFKGAKFCVGAYFQGVIFGDIADFMGCIFNNAVYFSRSTFKSDAIFSVENRAYHPALSIINIGRVEPEAEKFDAIYFDGVDFWDRVDFINRRFSSTTSFHNAVFKKPPLFHGCKLHQDTDFDGANFLDTKSRDAARAYRTLNLAMADTRARKEEALFYALEQRCLRNDSSISKWVKLLSWCYDKIADYGQSIGRPIIALTINLLIFFLFYSFMASPTLNIKHEFDVILIGKAINLSFQQFVRPFGIWVESGTGIANDLFGNNIGLIRIVASFESLFNVVFLSFILISLRWRFKRE